jgi:putative flippase GtrA
LRYVAVGWTAALVNYLVFVALLWGVTGLDTTIAIAVSSLVAMAYSFVGMRFGVFTRR